MQYEVSGTTIDGEEVIVTHDPNGPVYGTFAVYINGFEQEVDRVDRLRDGGSTFIRLADGGNIMFPRCIGNKDYTPTYNGKEIG